MGFVTEPASEFGRALMYLVVVSEAVNAVVFVTNSPLKFSDCHALEFFPFITLLAYTKKGLDLSSNRKQIQIIRNGYRS